MKKRFLIFILTTTLAFSQQEASVWYFGQNAGLKFNADGSVTPLSDGQLNTNEGCSSIADGNGNLLMYTDGRTVWDRNHIQMPNGSYAYGTELFGDGSSTQSGIIVPKPGSTNIYYIFTVDEPHHQNAAAYPNAFSGDYIEADSGQTPADDDGRNNGLNYSVVDLSVVGANGSIGDVVSRNNQLITYNTDPAGEEIKYKCSEKITAIKNQADGSFWVITHFINRFYAFKVTASGVSAAPIVSAIGSVQSLAGYRRNAIGYLKASPDGTKLAIAHQQLGDVAGAASFATGSVELFDFNGATGQVTNVVTAIPNVQAYGVEFSPDSKKLYATYRNAMLPDMELAQLNLNAANITSSKVVLYNGVNYLFALQLAPNNKIYLSTGYASSLGVINNPDVVGTGCNYVQIGQPIAANTYTRSGLPPFVTSFLDASFAVQNFCFGSQTQFTLNATQGVTSVNWDFGDGNGISGVNNPSHLYAAAGNYLVTVTATGSSGTVTKSKNITISTFPVAAAVIAAESICGIAGMTYDLGQHSATLLGGQSASAVGIAYFSSMSDAAAQVNPLPSTTSLLIGDNVFYAKIYNLVNPSCYVITSFTVTLFQKPVSNTPTDLMICDDGSNDGFAIFDLNQDSAAVLGAQSSSQFGVSYYATQSDADLDQNRLPQQYQNLQNPQTIYTRVSNLQHSACYATSAFQIGLFAMPTANPLPDLYACDDASDSHEPFDLASQTAVVLGSQPGLSYHVSYHLSQSDAAAGSNPLPGTFINTLTPQTIYVRVENAAHRECYATTSFVLHVMALPVIIMDDSYSICQGYPITITAPTGFDSYLWSDGSTGNALTVTTGGNYSLTVTHDYSNISCSAMHDFVVYQSSIASINEIWIRDWTSSDNGLTIIASGLGDYEYSIDGGPFQDTNTFNNLLSGPHTVSVRDKKGCGTTDDEVFLLAYPKFFTPNADGVNDTWQIDFSYVEPDMQIEIFDRYGKFIKNFTGLDPGWDGTLNGKALFSDDYWFVVKRKNGKVYKGHFSLKR